MEHIAEMEHNGRYRTSISEVLGRRPSGGLDVRQHWHLAIDAIEVINGNLDSGLSRNHRQVEQHVRGATHCGMDDDGVLEGLTRQDAARGDLLLNQVEHLLAGGASVA